MNLENARGVPLSSPHEDGDWNSSSVLHKTLKENVSLDSLSPPVFTGISTSLFKSSFNEKPFALKTLTNKAKCICVSTCH